MRVVLMKIEVTPDTLDVRKMWIHVTTSLKPNRPSHSYNVDRFVVGQTITDIILTIDKLNGSK